MSVHLNILGDGLSVEREISFSQAGRIIAFLGSEGGGSEAAEVQLANDDRALGSASPRQSIRELIDEAGASTNPQKIAVLGRQLAQQSSEQTFQSDAVKDLFPRAGEKIPKNFGRDLQATVAAGLIEEMPGQEGVYFVTRKGEAKLDAGFKGVSARKAGVKRVGTATAPTQIKARDEVTQIAVFTPDLEGFPNFHKLPTKGAKVMWILAFARANDVESLRPSEIGYVAGRLRDKLDPRDINGLTVTAAKNGWLAKSSDAYYSLLHKGDEYLKGLANEPTD